jgi:hypothetical protein
MLKLMRVNCLVAIGQLFWVASCKPMGAIAPTGLGLQAAESITAIDEL